MIRSIARSSLRLLVKILLALVSGFITWGIAYFMYEQFTTSGSYRTDTNHICSALGMSLQPGPNSIWPHVIATMRRAMLVSAGSLIVAVSLGPVFAFLQSKRWTRALGAQSESLLETWRAIPITMLFVLLAFSVQLGSEVTYILVPMPVTTAILSAAIMIALRSRSQMREHFYRQTFRRHLFLHLTLPELYFAIRSDLRQTVLYSVLLVVVLEYVQQPLSGNGVGALYYQLFATPPSPELLFALALPPLLVVAAIGALVVGLFDMGDIGSSA